MEEELLYGSWKGNNPSIFLDLEAKAPLFGFSLFRMVLPAACSPSQKPPLHPGLPIPVLLVLPPTHGPALVLFLCS